MKFIDYSNIPLLSDTWNDYKWITYIKTACHLKRSKMVLKHGKVNTTTWNDRGSHRLWERNELGNGKTWARCFLDWIFAKIVTVLKPRKPDADHPVTDQCSWKKCSSKFLLRLFFIPGEIPSWHETKPDLDKSVLKLSFLHCSSFLIAKKCDFHWHFACTQWHLYDCSTL